jgi:hypothetical protein
MFRPFLGRIKDHTYLNVRVGKIHDGWEWGPTSYYVTVNGRYVDTVRGTLEEAKERGIKYLAEAVDEMRETVRRYEAFMGQR